jgi:hypothetical protein
MTDADIYTLVEPKYFQGKTLYMIKHREHNYRENGRENSRRHYRRGDTECKEGVYNPYHNGSIIELTTGDKVHGEFVVFTRDALHEYIGENTNIVNVFCTTVTIPADGTLRRQAKLDRGGADGWDPCNCSVKSYLVADCIEITGQCDVFDTISADCLDVLSSTQLVHYAVLKEDKKVINGILDPKYELTTLLIYYEKLHLIDEMHLDTSKMSLNAASFSSDCNDGRPWQRLISKSLKFILDHKIKIIGKELLISCLMQYSDLETIQLFEGDESMNIGYSYNIMGAYESRPSYDQYSQPDLVTLQLEILEWLKDQGHIITILPMYLPNSEFLPVAQWLDKHNIKTIYDAS